ncbi:hypothetical protein [Nostoc commune]|uniref:hypothetical protein n=1 Tax=Nostoc commune TaxID=1178 RepID=UPI002072C95F|nr:hypothetical protein [Nostoc commune]
MVQIHDFCCNEILFFSDRKFMVWGGDVRKAIAIRKLTALPLKNLVTRPFD